MRTEQEWEQAVVSMRQLLLSATLQPDEAMIQELKVRFERVFDAHNAALRGYQKSTETVESLCKLVKAQQQDTRRLDWLEHEYPMLFVQLFGYVDKSLREAIDAAMSREGKQ